MKYVSNLRDIPKEEHYGLFYEAQEAFQSYEDRTEYCNAVKYIAFSSHQDLQKHLDSVIRQGKRLDDFVIVRTNPKTVKTDIIVSIN